MKTYIEVIMQNHRLQEMISRMNYPCDKANKLRVKVGKIAQRYCDNICSAFGQTITPTTGGEATKYPKEIYAKL